MTDNNSNERLLLEKYEPIAIVGAGLRYPGGAETLDEFSEFLRTGGSGIVDIPDSRWNQSEFYDENPQAPGKTVQSKGGFVDRIDEFDPKFFNISPKEASYCDPQHRLLLECSWHALESANIDPASLRDLNGGVYVGIAQMDFGFDIADLAPEDLIGNVGTGTAHSAACGRLSYFLGWRGPCMSIDTACSSSLVALHVAMQGLRRKECDIALCGGVNAIHHPRNHIVFSQSNMLSADGYCKTFDDSADGYGRSEGCGVVVLKRLSDAQKDGDDILALVRGSAAGQDGESGGLTVPNGVAQAALMREAISSALLEPKDIQYVEAHGTGTSLGDPIEVDAINTVFSDSHSSSNPIKIASIKSNLGHLEAGAGTCGIIKVIQQLREGVLYPHVNLKTPSRHIPWDNYVVSVPTELEPWSSPTRRRAIVNSFGFAGSISSVVLEQAPPVKERQYTQGSQSSVLTISAKNDAALRLQLESFKQFTKEVEKSDFASLCYTSNVGRSHLNARYAVSASSMQQLHEKISDRLALDKEETVETGQFRGGNIAFLFTGQGSQYLGMGSGIYNRYPVFNRCINECDALFEPHLNMSIKALMFGESEAAAEKINQTAYTQPALFSLQYALAKLWMSWGIQPDVLLGHSIGEVVAATVSGVFSLTDAVKLVAVRGSLMQSVKARGGMLAIQAKANAIAPLIKDNADLGFGAFNGPDQVVVSGALESINRLQAQLENDGVRSKLLPVSSAFHSPLMDEVHDPFEKVLSEITFNAPKLAFVSNLSGKIATEEEVCNPLYWIKHIREPVNFVAGMHCVQERGRHVMIEIGPSNALLNMGRKCVKQSDHLWMASINQEISADCETLESSLCKGYTAGLDISWQGYHQNVEQRKMQLPLYQFDRKRYWLPESGAQSSAVMQAGVDTHPLLGEEIIDTNTIDGQVREFVARINATHPSYLADHIVSGECVFPGSAYVEVLLAAQDAVFGDTTRMVSSLNIIEPMFLAEDSVTLIHTRMHGYDDQSSADVSVEIFSRTEDSDSNELRLHATAKLVCSTGNGCNEQQPWVNCLERMQAIFKDSGDILEQHDIDEVYGQYSDLGLPYGPAFRRIEKVSRYENRVAIGTLKATNTVAGQHLPPFMLDSALQVIAGVADISDAYLPVTFDNFRFFKKPKAELTVMVQLSSTEEQERTELVANMLITEAGRPVAIANEIVLKRLPGSSNKRRLYHRPEWLKTSLTSAQLSNANPREVIVLNNNQSAFDVVFSEAAEAGLNWHFADNIENAVKRITDDDAITDLCWFWLPRTDLSGEERLRIESEFNYRQLLNLTKALDNLAYDRVLNITLVTKGAQWVRGDQANDRDEAMLAASSLWGFGHVMLNEYPALQTTLIDLAPSAQDELENYRFIYKEMLASVPGEFQIASRNGYRFVKRILEQKMLKKNASDNFQLGIEEYGNFANIKQLPVEDTEPAEGEVCVAVKATGVNFKDVLNSLGMLKQYAEDNNIEYKKLPLGFESSGTVISAGPNAEFNVGDDVIVSQLGCMQKRMTVSCKAVVAKPTNLTFAQAAGISAAYVTAHYSLHALAHIKQGDRILIHAAAGGVGQAAVQLAKLAGAEIYATASPGKWELLRAQGINNIMNSRTLDFSDELLEMTNGEGVDIILNSLNKEYVPASVRCLSQNGRFVELGKIGIWSPERMTQERPDVDYRNFDLSEFEESELVAVNKRTLSTVVDHLNKGELAALPTESYSLDEIEEAFTVLSQGRNVGKLVINFDFEPELAESALRLNADATYLVTGAFGALGKSTLRKLKAAGAQHFTLTSRRPVPETELKMLQEELELELEPQLALGDVSRSADVTKIMAQIKASGRELGGVVHGAGVLSDGLLANQDWESFEKVFASKVFGTWFLHQAVASLQSLQFFVTYSSISSVLGMPGQGNYASANCYMDTLMQWRQANQQAGLSINWGPWADVGMAAQMDIKQIRGIEAKGVTFLKPSDGARALAKVISHSSAQTMIAEIDWDALRATRPIENALLSRLVQKASSRAEAVDMEELRKLSESDREKRIRLVLSERLAEVLRYDSPDEISADAKFLELGLDSLTSVELKTALEQAFAMPFPASMLFDYSDMRSLARYLNELLVPNTDETQENLNNNESEEIMSNVENMSDEQAEAELAELHEVS